jgi:hypothetical protein
MQTLWFTLLVSAICLEGLGRKYIPGVPSQFFYFLKDAVLLFGYFALRPPAAVRKTIRLLYGGFAAVLPMAIGWTVIELANPRQASWVLGLIGLRAYWLWWIAPPIIAGVLQNETTRRRAIYVLVGVAAMVSILAVFQFASPADSDLNLYSVVDGEEIHASDMATVAATGRARVASTFSFLSGFVDFCLLVPTLLLSIGLEARERRIRTIALAGTAATAAVIPMSGSRGSVVVGAMVLVLMAWASGLFFTRIGRRVLVGGVAAAVLAVVAFPDAILGIQSRFEDTEETAGRVAEIAVALPPVALSYFDYPAIGLGTGMQQNVRFSMQVSPDDYYSENEVGRYLIELGPVGYLLVWTAKLGLMVALVRGYFILKRVGKRGAAGAALSYAVLTMLGNMTFDHIWQALYFLGCGFVLAEVVAALRSEQHPLLDQRATPAQ